MSFRYHGNWCGPGWTAGQYKDASDVTSKDRTVPAVDALDEACKEHDLAIADATSNEDLIRANKKFKQETKELGIKAVVAGVLVEHFGPTVHKKPSKAQAHHSSRMPRLRIDGEAKPHVVPLPEDDEMDWEPAPPSASEDTSKALVTRSSGGQGTVGRRRNDETLPSNIPYSIRSPWPKTQQAVCTYYNFIGQNRITDFTATDVQTHTGVQVFRLNSPYDCRVTDASDGTTEATLANPDSADGSINVATYFNYYMNYYNYWHVVRSRYRVRIWVYPEDPELHSSDTDIALIVYFYHNGAQMPPKSSHSNGNVLVPHYIRREHDNMYYMVCDYRPFEAGETQTSQMNRHTAAGTYDPNTFHHEVAEDELKQTWHKANEVPPTEEYLSIYLSQAPTGSKVNIMYRMEVTIEYEVQFKDLKFQYQYPTQDTLVNVSAGIAGQIQ